MTYIQRLSSKYLTSYDHVLLRCDRDGGSAVNLNAMTQDRAITPM